LQLGSDCPFFIYNTPCLGTSRGEILEPLSVQLHNYYITLIHPGIHISTAWAFGEIRPDRSARGSLTPLISKGPEHWKGQLINDFEAAVFPQYPEIARIRDHFYEKGAVFASMSGSGSSVFGIFKEPTHLKKDFPPHYFIRESIPAGFEKTGI
jgi:4-diphosphocytidyl-2-C-methyl-D-erythritol kinase